MRIKISEAILVITLSAIVLGSSVASSSLIRTQTIASYGQITESTSVNGTLEVEGRFIVNGAGQTIYLRGLTRDGLEMPIGSNGMSQADVNSGNYGSLITQNDFVVMASMGANCVRLPFGWGWLEPQIGVYNMTYVARLDQVIGWAESNNLYVILSLQNSALQYPYVASWITDPGFWTGSQNASQQQSFIDLWSWLSNRYENDPKILYDLINEPNSPALINQLGEGGELTICFPTLFEQGGLYDRTIAAIRANGDNKICIVHTVGGDNWGIDPGTYPTKISDSNVLYSTHWYYPTSSTTDMGWYEKLVSRAYQFSLNNNVPIFIGEWGIPWRLTDLTEDEQNNWTQEHCQTYANLGFNWCYWSFKRDCYAIYYCDEGSAIFNDTLRPMASVLTEYMSG